MITPLLILWYYLAVKFEGVVPSNQILFMCIFVLLPSVLIFLSVGSWLPMAGSIICVIAINHSPPSASADPFHWRVHMRHLLLFITAICNSIQFAWIMDLIGEVTIIIMMMMMLMNIDLYLNIYFYRQGGLPFCMMIHCISSVIDPVNSSSMATQHG